MQVQSSDVIIKITGSRDRSHFNLRCVWGQKHLHTNFVLTAPISIWISFLTGKCEESLATPLPYSSFTSSSVYARGYGAGYAKLNRRQGVWVCRERESILMSLYVSIRILTVFQFSSFTKLGAGGWSPLDTDHYQWLQVDLGSRKQVVAIATQGRYSSSDWTSQYRLLYSDTQKNWRPYLQDGNIWVTYSNVESSKLYTIPTSIIEHLYTIQLMCWIMAERTSYSH